MCVLVESAQGTPFDRMNRMRGHRFLASSNTESIQIFIGQRAHARRRPTLQNPERVTAIARIEGRESGRLPRNLPGQEFRPRTRTCLVHAGTSPWKYRWLRWLHFSNPVNPPGRSRDIPGSPLLPDRHAAEAALTPRVTGVMWITMTWIDLNASVASYTSNSISHAAAQKTAPRTVGGPRRPAIP
jgi:hypothetical protein